MALIYQNFARGQLIDSNTSLHTAQTAIICNLWLKSLSDVDEMVQISLNRAVGGSLYSAQVLLKPGWQADVTEIILGIGDSVEASSTSADVVNYELTGTAITP